MNMGEFRLHANISWREPVMESTPLETRNATVSEVKFCAAKAAGITVKELDSKSRHRDCVTARRLVMYYLNKKHGFSLDKTAGFSGGKDHATVLFSNRRYENLIEVGDGIMIDARDRFNYELLKISKTINTL